MTTMQTSRIAPDATALPQNSGIAAGPMRLGNRLSRAEAAPRLNCGRHHTMLAMAVASAQPQPSTGLTCSLIAAKGRRPVLRAT